jgi:hypothetical protein
VQLDFTSAHHPKRDLALVNHSKQNHAFDKANLFWPLSLNKHKKQLIVSSLLENPWPISTTIERRIARRSILGTLSSVSIMLLSIEHGQLSDGVS